ncbi:MAG: DUF6152 family protein [Vicinamibacterales bacterium]
MRSPILALLLAIASMLGLLTSTSSAHHSISGYYDTSRDVTIEGTVSQFRFVQPHPFVVVDVRRGSATEQWELELDNRWELAEVGITETTLKPGDRVIVSGSPARREPQHMYVQRLNRPADGFGFEQVGNRPRLRKSAR